MIQIRKKNGEVVPVPEGCFVELINDADQSVNLVCFQQDPHTVVQVTPQTRSAIRYEALFAKFGVVFNKLMILRNAE